MLIRHETVTIHIQNDPMYYENVHVLLYLTFMRHCVLCIVYEYVWKLQNFICLHCIQYAILAYVVLW